jgi:hypothetical protein
MIVRVDFKQLAGPAACHGAMRLKFQMLNWVRFAGRRILTTRNPESNNRRTFQQSLRSPRLRGGCLTLSAQPHPRTKMHNRTLFWLRSAETPSPHPTHPCASVCIRGPFGYFPPLNSPTPQTSPPHKSAPPQPGTPGPAAPSPGQTFCPDSMADSTASIF